ncbi:MAG: DUF4864 domain-containing protein [Pseudomonadota bacterium]
MIRWVAAALLALGLAGPVAAQQEDIRGVIDKQLQAFLADDFATAFTFASPSIKRMFGTAENFGQMVKQGYPMVWRPADVQFLGLENRNGTQVQRVLITDGSGTLYGLDYFMIETEHGWQINGVQILPAPDIGV